MIRFAFWMGCHGSWVDYRLEATWQEAVMVGQIRADQTCKKAVKLRTGEEKIGLKSAQDTKFNNFGPLVMENE